MRFQFSQQRVWTWLSSGLLRRVVWYKLTDVSKVLAASIIIDRRCLKVTVIKTIPAQKSRMLQYKFIRNIQWIQIWKQIVIYYALRFVLKIYLILFTDKILMHIIPCKIILHTLSKYILLRMPCPFSFRTGLILVRIIHYNPWFT
jgi:hypothetical protein